MNGPAIYTVGNNVGIGSAEPTASLEVKGTVKMFKNTPVSKYNAQPGASGQLYTETAATDGFVVVRMSAGANQNGSASCVVDGTTLGVQSYAYVSNGNLSEASLTTPVPKGATWAVNFGRFDTNGYPHIYIYWIPLGQ
jgi:hypothetical protein